LLMNLKKIKTETISDVLRLMNMIFVTFKEFYEILKTPIY